MTCWWPFFDPCCVLSAVLLGSFGDLVRSCWLSFWWSLFVHLFVCLGSVGRLVWSCWWSCWVLFNGLAGSCLGCLILMFLVVLLVNFVCPCCCLGPVGGLVWSLSWFLWLSFWSFLLIVPLVLHVGFLFDLFGVFLCLFGGLVAS